MKKIILISSIFLAAFSYTAESQVSFSINIGRQPVWGPVGYNHVDYYYLPDLDVYYDVPRGLFVYYDDGRWNFAPSLPGRFGNYDLYNSYKVVINERNPWMREDYYRDHFRAYRGQSQPIIRDSHDTRYYAQKQRYDQDRRFGDHGNYGRDNGRGNDGKNYDRGNKDHDNHGRDDHDRGGDRDRH